MRGQRWARPEWHEVRAVAHWAALYSHMAPELGLLQVDVAGCKLAAAQAAILKSMGRKAGWPDLHLPVARGGYHALFIEAKRRDGGELSQAQVEIHAMLRSQGNLVKVCLGSDAIIEAITDYLAMEVK